MRLDYPFAERLSISSGKGTLDSLKNVITQLREDYCFDVEFEKHTIGSDIESISVSFPKDYSLCKIDLVLEVIDYHRCIGVAVIVEERIDER